MSECDRADLKRAAPSAAPVAEQLAVVSIAMVMRARCLRGLGLDPIVLRPAGFLISRRRPPSASSPSRSTNGSETARGDQLPELQRLDGGGVQ